MAHNPEHHLFVYGTLAPGEANYHLMDGMRGTWQRARVKGRRGQCEWGPYKGYPAFYAEKTDEFVDGQVFSSTDLPDHWDRLDAFEGEAYPRVTIKAVLEDGTEIATQIYATIRANDAKEK